MSNGKMRNSLRRLRKEKLLPLREVGEKLGIPFQTLANYEKSENPLPAEVVRKAAKFFGVSETKINEEPLILNEDVPPYRITSIGIDLLKTETLQNLKKEFSELLGGSHEPTTTKIMHSLYSITEELKRRPQLLIHEKRKAPPASSGLTSQEEDALGAFLSEVGPGDSGESGPSSATGEPPPQKEKPSPPSSPGTKPRRSGGATKD